MQYLDSTTISSSVTLQRLTWIIVLLIVMVAVFLLMRTMPYYKTKKAYIAFFLLFATVMFVIKLKIDPNADKKNIFTQVNTQVEYRCRVTNQEEIEYLEANPDVENLENHIYRFTVTKKYDASGDWTWNRSDFVIDNISQ